MSQPERVFRATDPAAVRESLDRRQKEHEAFFERVAEFSKGHLDGIDLHVVGNGRGMWANHLATTINGEKVDGSPVWTPRGLCRQFGDRGVAAEIPSGWHYYQKEGEVRPYRGGRDANSKAAVQALKDLNATSPGGLRAWINREFGVPLGVFGGWGFEPVGDNFYVLWGASRFENSWEGNEHFEQVAMSDYWLDREAADKAA